MAAGNQVNLSTTSINAQVAADAAYVRSVYDWCKRKVLQYQTQFGTTPSTANTTLQGAPYGFTAADAAAITNLITDLAMLAGLIEGTPQAPPRDARNDCATLMGIQ